jgi:hypothetical protein
MVDSRMESDFEPLPYLRGAPPPSEDARIAYATEYIAYQLGQINQKMDRLIAAIEDLVEEEE